MKIRQLTDEYLFELGHRIRVVRTFLRLSQRDFALEIKTSAAHVSKLESGQCPPNLFHIIRIMELAKQDAYLKEHLSWDWLLEGTGKGVLG